jgi:predicted transcriptional regulator
MRTTSTLSITLPPEMLAQAQEIARKEHRTMSELIREALRQYERREWWNNLNAYGRKTAESARVGSDQDLVKAVHELRRRSPRPSGGPRK